MIKLRSIATALLLCVTLLPARAFVSEYTSSGAYKIIIKINGDATPTGGDVGELRRILTDAQTPITGVNSIHTIWVSGKDFKTRTTPNDIFTFNTKMPNMDLVQQEFSAKSGARTLLYLVKHDQDNSVSFKVTYKGTDYTIKAVKAP